MDTALLLEKGAVVLLRTAVYHAIGTVGDLFDVGGVAFVRLHDASYLGDTGRYFDATTKPIHEVDASEIEPVGGEGILDVQVAMIGDAARALPYERKQR
jgi:hypothetical protein